MRDAPLSVENGECDGSYQVFVAPATATRAMTDAMRLCTGISSGWGLTAKPGYTPFGGDFKTLKP